ncbi:MAG: MBL fold metallo-hydrolase [Anaerovoracaceae bacterium]|jgi:L-ascorbate metabolism protein UlaG (beta-lactamase superfamily)
MSENEKIKITWHGHSCFAIEYDGYTIVTDPYTGVPGYPPLHVEADEVFCSHDHADHNFVSAVKKKNSGKKSPFKITEIGCFHDDKKGALRGKCVMRIFEAGGIRVAHLADIGEMPDKDTVEKLKGLDCALIPVGGFYTVDGKQAYKIIEAIDPVVAVPMHYRKGSCGYREISGPDDFLSCAVDRPVIKTGSTFEIGGNSRCIIVPEVKGMANEF